MPYENSDITIFGETNYRNQSRSFGIKRDDRRRHMYIVGKTGMGKTTLLENMIISDIIHGEGCCYIDPHGDTAEKILDFIPASRINDVVYLNPSDINFPIAFNVLESVDEVDKNFVASGLISVFKKLWADSWGPRLEYILRNAILALLDYPGSTLLGIMRILVDKDYRDKVVEKIKDPVVKSFWTNEYSKWNERTLQEVISPIQNKVGQFLSNFLIRNIVGQVKSTIDLRALMDDRKILIMNLSKGMIGEDTMQLLGSMIVTKLYLAAMSRVDIPEKDRKDFYLYVDEFQNFATESFAGILSEARKYKLNLIVAHQYIEQLPEQVSAAIFGNVGTLICFRVGAADAEELVKEFTPFFTEEDLVNLPSFCIYLKLMIDGISSDPFSAKTLPPLYDDLVTHNAEKVTKVSRERYANPRSVVEDKINRWSGIELSDNMARTVSGESSTPRQPAPPRREPAMAKPQPAFAPATTQQAKKNFEDDRKKFKAVCDMCKKDTMLPFAPAPDKSVYCEECFKLVREERRKKKDERSVPVEDKLKGLKEFVDKKIADAPSISLSEAVSKQPVDFSGRPVASARPKTNDRSKTDEIRSRPMPPVRQIPSSDESEGLKHSPSQAMVAKPKPAVNVDRQDLPRQAPKKPLAPAVPNRLVSHRSQPVAEETHVPTFAPKPEPATLEAAPQAHNQSQSANGSDSQLEWYQQAKEMLKSIKGDDVFDNDRSRDASWMD